MINKKLRRKIRKYFGFIYSKALAKYKERKYKEFVNNDITRLTPPISQQRIYYLGITEHPNLGDMGQHYCILNWISKNFPDSELLSFKSSTVVNPFVDFPSKLKTIYRPNDIIIFQSGYCTQDLGGDHELMHRMIIDKIPYAKILMMPQTIFFQHEKNKKRTSKSYNQATNMLFLARDTVSYNIAKEMFPNIEVQAFPDIVTTLIGKYTFENERKGVCFCLRDDSEKFYSDKELQNLKKQIEEIEPITTTDTTISTSEEKIRKNLQHYIEKQIIFFSKYKIVITDRYHGTIFSLAAGTPVIIIKTNDHKVITGANWFKGVYDDYVYVASDLKEAYKLYEQIKTKKLTHKLSPYFEENYYSHLKEIFYQLAFKEA